MDSEVNRNDAVENSQDSIREQIELLRSNMKVRKMREKKTP